MNTEDPIVIGIDLGTTNSLLAFIKDGDPRIIPNERGDRMTPSVVYFKEDGQIIVGEMAKSQAVLNSDRTISEVKLAMGRNTAYTIGLATYSAADISGLILKTLKENAERYLDQPVRDAVITVPAYFDERQREDTLKAANIAGLNVLRLLNEPTAAALTYGLGQKTGAHLLVIDLGGGTLDITLMAYQDNVFRVLGVGGSTAIGGTDFDHKIVDYIQSEFLAAHGFDLRQDKIALQQLVIHSEKAKIDLSSSPETRVMIPYITVTEKGPVHLNQALTRPVFEQLTQEILDEISQHIQAMFDQAGLTADWVDTVILVGGSTRVPALETLVKTILYNPEPQPGTEKDTSVDPSNCSVIRRTINPDEAVARGAGILAGILSGTMTGIEFHDITPHDLGIEDDKGQFTNILPRGTAYPAEASRLFTTTEDFQEAVYIHVLQQVGMTAERNSVSLGWFRLKTDESKRKSESNIDVSFAIDANGLLRVSALDLDNGEHKEITITDTDIIGVATGRPDHPDDVQPRELSQLIHSTSLTAN
jgi:molecular chaperone DnaK